MFLASLRPLATWARAFSTTSVLEAGYKLKSHSGAKKRWRSSPGLQSFKRGRAGRAHLNTSKAPARLNRLGNTAYSTPAQTHKLRKVLLPYGSG
ncbi:Ribosomal protein L35 [Mycena chlorophos]|uniref:Ribosomal protein L35 n=1 Tax=Mycena chlorophos TaxID=658473 RepID=A0A8H6VQP6_MYCCL|nr:Ribosomal protein L35 [Mycena chlorophos]